LLGRSLQKSKINNRESSIIHPSIHPPHDAEFSPMVISPVPNENSRMSPKDNRKVTAEEALRQCRRNRREARILEGGDRPCEIESPSQASRISPPVSTPAKSKAG